MIAAGIENNFAQYDAASGSDRNYAKIADEMRAKHQQLN